MLNIFAVLLSTVIQSDCTSQSQKNLGSSQLEVLPKYNNNNNNNNDRITNNNNNDNNIINNNKGANEPSALLYTG